MVDTPREKCMYTGMLRNKNKPVMEKGQDRQGIKENGGNSTDKWEQSTETDGAKVAKITAESEKKAGRQRETVCF